jgi:hypothetical protein
MENPAETGVLDRVGPRLGSKLKARSSTLEAKFPNLGL